jgi:hypothetical protein
MDVAHDFNAVSHVAIENEVTADRKMPNAGGDIVTRSTHFRVARERSALLVEKLEQPIRGGGIIAGDIGPDVDPLRLAPCVASVACACSPSGLGGRAAPGFFLDGID